MVLAATTDESSPLLPKGHQAKAKKKPTPLPKLQIGILLLLHLAEPLTAQCINPFIKQLISELDITGGDEKKVGYYAGMIQSIFYITEAIFVFQWSRLSDYIGRKPVLLVGLSGLCLSMICFGLSRSFWSLVVSRSLVGMLNGNTGVMKSMIGEITDSTNVAQAFALHPMFFAVGAAVGPMIGGQLAKPHDRWPGVFSHPFWIKFPYFLPCAGSAAFSAFAFVITALFLKESVKRRRPRDRSLSSEALTPEQDDDAPPPLSTVLVRPVIVSVANYAAVALADIAFVALVPLFFAIPIELGGLGLPPPTIGTILGTLGLASGIIQPLLMARVVDRFGPKRVFQTGFSMHVPLYLSFPLINMYAKAHGITPCVWALVGVQIAMMVVFGMSFVAIFTFITSSAPNSRSLGAVNGVAQSMASVARAIGPASSTSLFSTSLERGWLGGYAVYVIMVITSIVLLYPSTLLPRDLWPKEDEGRDD